MAETKFSKSHNCRVSAGGAIQRGVSLPTKFEVIVAKFTLARAMARPILSNIG